MYVISRLILHPSDQNSAELKLHEFSFDFKLVEPNEKTIVQDRDYWTRSYLHTWGSTAYKQNISSKSTQNKLIISGKNGIVTIYKIEGEFDEQQIEIIKNYLKDGMLIEEIYKYVEEKGWSWVRYKFFKEANNT